MTPGPVFRPVAPPADGLRGAFAAARRRRAAKAGTVGAAGVVAVVLVVSSLGPSGVPTLVQEPLPPARDGGVVASASPAATLRPPAAAPRVDAGGAVSGPAVSGAGGVVGPAASPQAPVRAHASGAQPRAQAAVSGAMVRTSSYGYSNDIACPAAKRPAGGRALCVDVTAVANADGTTTMTAEICNADTASDAVTYPSAREVDLAVMGNGHELWRWSTGRRFAATPHGLDIGVGECLMWTTTWQQVDAAGRPVPKGTYDVVADFDAQQLTGADRRATYSVTYY